MITTEKKRINDGYILDKTKQYSTHGCEGKLRRQMCWVSITMLKKAE